MNIIDPQTLKRRIDEERKLFLWSENIGYCFEADIDTGIQEVAPGLSANVTPAIGAPHLKEAWINIEEAKAWIAKQEQQ